MDPERLATLMLEHIGCLVEKIPETDEKTPDFFVTLECDQYLIELKAKEANPEQIRERDEQLDAGEIYEEFEPVLRQNRLSGIVRDATGQLDSHNHDGIFRLAWFMAIGHNASAKMHQFESTLYGSTTLVDWSENGTAGDCYYFYNSDFHRYRQSLDGAIVSTQQELKLCLNNYSPRYENLKASSLVRAFANGVCDPVQREEAGEAYIVDSEVDRNNLQDVLDYLRRKYKQERLTNMTMNHMSATIAVPRNET